MQYNLLVLGPMEHREGETIVRPANTRRLGEILTTMARAINPAQPPFRIITPEAPDDNVIIKMVLDEIEQADLVLIDLTGERPSVCYEAAIVHALGLPHIFVTEDASSPFYFRTVRVIQNFNMEANFSPLTPAPSHAQLLNRLQRFLGSADGRREMAGNILTQHFDDLPLVDLSGPAGMAASYFANMVKRFIRPEGYASGEAWDFVFEQRERSLFGRFSRAPKSFPAAVKALVTIEPPNKLAKEYSSDWDAAKRRLQELGVNVRQATISQRGSQDKRGFSGWFDADGLAKGETVCFDVPTIVYPLKDSPRMIRLGRKKSKFSGAQKQIVELVEFRALEKMLDSFKRNIFFHIGDMRDSNKDRYFYRTLDEMPELLRTLR